MAVDEVNCSFKERVIFKQYTPNKHKCFGIKIYKLCDSILHLMLRSRMMELYINFFFNLHSGGGGGWNEGPLDTAAT
jgi:hypothetical protein